MSSFVAPDTASGTKNQSQRRVRGNTKLWPRLRYRQPFLSLWASCCLHSLSGGARSCVSTGSRRGWLEWSCVRSPCWHSPDARVIWTDRTDGIPGFVCADCAWIRYRLADGFDAVVSCHHQSVSDPALASIGRAIPSFESVEMDSGNNVRQPTD